MKDAVIAAGIVAAMNAFALFAALVVTAVLGSGPAQHLAIIGFAAVYLVATWRAIGRVAEDQGWTTFRRQLVYAIGHFLTLRFVLEIAATYLFGTAPEA